MLSKQEIAGLRELLAKATPGPWQVYGAEQNCFGPADEIYVAQCFARSGYYAGRQDWKENAALIASAISALPALLDIAEAVANAPTGLLSRGPDRGTWRYYNSGEAGNPEAMDMDGKLVAVLPLAGEVANG